MMTDLPGLTSLRTLLADGHGWTMLTAVNLMLFSLLHNPCGTTILTIYRETNSRKWAALSVVITLGVAFLVTFLTASIAVWLGGPESLAAGRRPAAALPSGRPGPLAQSIHRPRAAHPGPRRRQAWEGGPGSPVTASAPASRASQRRPERLEMETPRARPVGIIDRVYVHRRG